MTSGKSYCFIGDRLERVEDQLVLVDSKRGFGINSQLALKVETIVELEEFRKYEDYIHFLNLILSVPIGGHAEFNCNYF